MPRKTRRPPPPRPTRTSTGGRTACSPQLAKAIARSIRGGSEFGVACEIAGIDRTTGHAWMQRGEAGEQPFDDFRKLVMRAGARAKSEALKEIKAAVTPGEGGVLDWRARDRWLALVDPEHFSPQTVVTVKAQQEAIDVVLRRLRARLDPATFATVVRALADEPGSGPSSGDVGAD